MRCPGRKGHHVGKSVVFERSSYILGRVHRPGVNHEIGNNVLSEPQGRGMGRAVRTELWEWVGELSKWPLAGALEAADAANVWILARRSHFEGRFAIRSWSCLMPPY